MASVGMAPTSGVRESGGGVDRLPEEMNDMKIRDDKEMEATVVDGNGMETGHIIVTTIGGKNGQPKQGCKCLYLDIDDDRKEVGTTVTHADLEPRRSRTDLNSKTGAFLMVLTILLGLLCFILCLIAEATRSQVQFLLTFTSFICILLHIFMLFAA
ncbi:uncharacterized protein [Arachis hypogaea]|uniref:uncharacterized protein isoform X1 n=1 Tax=Arachis hypogaea TaxID=3818 RepID=UPI000DECFD8D|nr:uncharacterized protein LOC112732454 isoform X1 [Arachis hypogaea]XP_025636961.1 uncharacterized protein LOC112732454 isoform X1 [Arachis hypogaea]XP_025636962.1 uncharacterized protein LOC112732454 isoform X1 [Arachis hypogaea]XP_025636963.1 uncharacterized protein LOC112732454 isoform X1 [Arachis hypogaea]